MNSTRVHWNVPLLMLCGDATCTWAMLHLRLLSTIFVFIWAFILAATDWKETQKQNKTKTCKKGKWRQAEQNVCNWIKNVHMLALQAQRRKKNEPIAIHTNNLSLIRRCLNDPIVETARNRSHWLRFSSWYVISTSANEIISQNLPHCTTAPGDVIHMRFSPVSLKYPTLCELSGHLFDLLPRPVQLFYLLLIVRLMQFNFVHLTR